MPASAPHRIDRYVLEHELGRGGMGVVHAAWDTRLNRRVALKILPPGLAADPAYVARFEQEMRVASALEHPHVVPVHEVGRDDGALFIAMRLVDGEDLRTVLDREGAMDPARAGRIARQIGGALDAAHTMGLIHRDVKPANVLLTGTGEDEHAYLVDFGLAREAAAHAQLTAPGEWIGTLDYAAPEQIAAVPLRPAADVYGLGCLAFHMLTGAPPFGGSMAQKIQGHTHEPLPSIGGPLASSVDPILARATDKDPARRQPSAGELGRELDAALRGEQAAPAPPFAGAAVAPEAGRGTAVTAARPATPRPARPAAAAAPAAAARRRRPAALAALGLALVASVVAVLALSGGDDDPAPRAEATTGTKTSKRPRTVAPPPTTAYTAPQGGYTAQLPSGEGWAIQGEQRIGAILRTTVTGPRGAQLWIDATPQVRPTFGTEGRSQITTETYSTPVGTVRGYRFRGVPDFCAGGCLDDQLDLGGHGFAILGGPTQQARVAARRAMRSLRPVGAAPATTTTTTATTIPTAPATTATTPPATTGKAQKPKPAKAKGRAKDKPAETYTIVTDG